MGIWMDMEGNEPWIDFNLLFECVGLAAISRLRTFVDYVVPSCLVTVLSPLRQYCRIWVAAATAIMAARPVAVKCILSRFIRLLSHSYSLTLSCTC